MSIYLIAQLQIHDRERYSKYSGGFMEIFERYGGTILAVDESVEPLEGEWDFTRTVLLEFPSEAQARQWYQSPEYQALAQHRFASADANVVMVKGLNA